MHSAPSVEQPLGGGCLCGAVRFEVTRPLSSAGYCHCRRCQRRTGTAASANGRVAAQGFRLLSELDRLRTWTPTDGAPKLFCGDCGGHVLSGDPLHDDEVAIRLGAFDADPGIRPGYRQWLDSAAAWEAVPDDGLPRFPRGRAG